MEFVLLKQTTNFILKPLAWLFSFVIDLIYNGVAALTTTNSMGITIILFTLIIRVLIFPLSLRQQRSTRKMQRLQPKIQKIQEKYKDNKDPESARRMNMEMNDLYKENKTSPLSGCLPMLIQLPIIFVLFEILRNLAFYITDYGAYFDQITTTVMNVPAYDSLLQEMFPNLIKGLRGFDIAEFSSVKDLLSYFTASSWNELYEAVPALAQNAEFVSTVKLTQDINSFLGFNLSGNGSLTWPGIIWPLVTGGTTWLQSFLMTRANDKRTIAAGGDPKSQNNQTMKIMNYVFPVMTAAFTLSMPLGIALYWISSNVFSLLQQLLIDKIVDDEEYKQALAHKKELEEKRRLRELTKSSVDKKTGKRIGTAEMSAAQRSLMAGNRKAGAQQAAAAKNDQTGTALGYDTETFGSPETSQEENK